MKRKLYTIGICLFGIFFIVLGYLYMVADAMAEAGRIRNIWLLDDTSMRNDSMFIYRETIKAEYEGPPDREAFRKKILEHGCVTELPRSSQDTIVRNDTVIIKTVVSHLW